MRFQIVVVFSLLLVTSFCIDSNEASSSISPVSSNNTANSTIGNHVKSRVTDAILFTYGFIDGLNGILGLSGLEPCLISSELTLDQYENAIDLLKTGTFKNIVDGLSALGAAFQDTAQSLENCEVVGQDLKLVESVAEIFKNPKILLVDAENTLVNGANVDEQIHAAIDEKETGDYYGFGTSIGEIVGLASTRTPQI